MLGMQRDVDGRVEGGLERGDEIVEDDANRTTSSGIGPPTSKRVISENEGFHN